MITKVIWPTTIPLELRRELDRFVDDIIRNYTDLEARVTALEP